MGFRPTEPRGGEGLKPCPFCAGPARTFDYNGATQAGCAGDFKDCAGSDVMAPVVMWNRRPPVVHGWPDREDIEALKSLATQQACITGRDRAAIERVVALFPPVVGWPDREALARVIDSEAFDHPIVHPQHLILRRAKARSKADAIIALFPPVVGWRMVPVEPTPEMIEAGRKVDGWGFTSDLDREAAAATYRAMLAAAPLTDGVGE